MTDIAHDDRFDLIFFDKIEQHFPELLEDLPLGHLLVKAQIWQESRFDPQAVSSAGAMGLMQLMPGTASDLKVDDPFDPVQNIDGGVRYLADQYRHLLEIPTYEERIRFALASYNGGRGYINHALVQARDAEGLPASFRRWNREGRPPGFWQQWSVAREYLRTDKIRCDWEQMWDYVERIEGRYRHYLGIARERSA